MEGIYAQSRAPDAAQRRFDGALQSRGPYHCDGARNLDVGAAVFGVTTTIRY
jgi:hypothetical protein